MKSAVRPAPWQMTFIQWVLLFAVATSPVYILPAGGPQIGHFATLVLILAAISRPVHLVPADHLLGWLCFVALVRTAVGVTIEEGNPAYFDDVAFTVFPVLSFLAIRQMAYDPANDRVIRNGLLIALFITVTVLVATGDYTLTGQIERAVGTFQNPNQLAYFSVLATAMLALLFFTRRISDALLIAGLVLTTFLSLVALSKSGMLAQYLALGVIIQSYLREKLGDIAAMLILSLGFVALTLFLFSGVFDDLTFMRRLSDIGQQQDDSFAERGYFASLNGNPLHFLFGLGPAGSHEVVGHEIHSTIASFFGKYGVIGLLLFAGFLIDWIVKLWRAFGFWQTAAMTVGFLLYGIAHNGARFAMFWILAAVSYAFAQRTIYARQMPMPTTVARG
ncbi:hypothetical protein WJT74_05615 [Sphingomicrobium sp. XHP0239]|uniref:O-antigen ligase family protein n=1 Tax=Sphingomicrobium maritimum TaxID=3133972 RepID=UPI0031CC47B8